MFGGGEGYVFDGVDIGCDGGWDVFLVLYEIFDEFG